MDNKVIELIKTWLSQSEGRRAEIEFSKRWINIRLSERAEGDRRSEIARHIDFDQLKASKINLLIPAIETCIERLLVAQQNARERKNP